jgi:hypothetical protein
MNPDVYLLNGDLYSRVKDVSQYCFGIVRHDTKFKSSPRLFSKPTGDARKDDIILFQEIDKGWLKVVGIFVDNQSFRSPSPQYNPIPVYLHVRHLKARSWKLG